VSNLQLFQRYATAENVVTNNALLLLQRVYQHSQLRFRELMLSLWENGHPIPDFGMRFGQQERGRASVPDGVLVQESVKVVVETKLGAVFDIDQVRRHFAELKGYKHRFALLLGTEQIDLSAPGYTDLAREADAQGIALAAVSFESLVAKVNALYGPHHEDMIGLVADFEAFCDGFQLLPTDKWTVFVPPCGTSLAHNISERLYYCPADRSVRKTRYLGIYAQKSIQALGTINKVISSPVVDLQSGTVQSALGDRLTTDEEARIARACVQAQRLGWTIDTGHTFFLCDALEATDFRKSSPNGIQNRRYLDLRKFVDPVPSDLASLATALREATWI
jgi:hypothetical protein